MLKIYMNNVHKNKEGFGIIETLVVILVLVVIAAVGCTAYRNHHKVKTSYVSTTKYTTKAPNIYADWKTFSSTSFGLAFKYPSTWTTTPDATQCSGAIPVTITPGNIELSQAATAINASLNQYTLSIEKYGTESTNCATDGNNFDTGIAQPYIDSTSKLTAGAFKNDWLTFFGDKIPIADSGLITDSQYSTSPSKFLDAGTLAYNGSTYQIEINTSSVVGQQYEQPVPMNINLLETTSLYKDTLNLLDSISKNNSVSTDPYLGWWVYCNTTVKACFNYPPTWTSAQYGGYENTAKTELVSLNSPTNKDGLSGEAYIARITKLNTQNSDLDVVGAVIDNDQPIYAVYNDDYVTSNNLKVGTTQNLFYGNQAFNTRTGSVAFDGTPDINGSAAITNLEEAKAWFNTAEAKEVLLVMQSFFYQ